MVPARLAPFDLAEDFYKERLLPLRRRGTANVRAEMYTLFDYADAHNLTGDQIKEIAKTLSDRYSEQSLYQGLVAAGGAGALDAYRRGGVGRGQVIVPTGMDVDMFWKIMNFAKGDEVKLKPALDRLSNQELIEFNYIAQSLGVKYPYDIHATIMERGLSEYDLYKMQRLAESKLRMSLERGGSGFYSLPPREAKKEALRESKRRITPVQKEKVNFPDPEVMMFQEGCSEYRSALEEARKLHKIVVLDLDELRTIRFGLIEITTHARNGSQVMVYSKTDTNDIWEYGCPEEIDIQSIAVRVSTDLEVRVLPQLKDLALSWKNVPSVDIDKVVESLDPSHTSSPANRQWMKKCLMSFQKNTWDRKMQRAINSDAYRKGLEQLADEMGKPRESLVKAWEKAVSKGNG